jgi:hypothetical protein
MRVRALVAGIAVCGTALAGCGARAARDTVAGPAALRAPVAAPAPLSTAPGPCAAVVDRTLRTVGARIDARAALRRRRAGRAPTLVAALTRPAPPACAATASQTVADTVGAIGERLVRAEATGPEVRGALALVARDPAVVRAVRRRDAAGLRAAIVHFFRIRRLHIVRVRATTAGGRLVNDVGGPFVLAPATRAVHGPGGRVLGRVTLSVQDNAGYIKLMRRFTGAAVVLRTRAGVVPGSAPAPAAIPSRGIVAERGRRYAAFRFATRAFPAGRLSVALLVPVTGSSR